MSPSDICDGVAMTGDVDLPSSAMRVHGPDLVEVLLHVPSATPAARQNHDVSRRKAMPRAVFFIHGAFAFKHDEPLRRRARRRAEPAAFAT